MNKIITEDNVQNKLEKELLLLNKLLETAVKKINEITFMMRQHETKKNRKE